MNCDLDGLWQSMVKILDVDGKVIGSGFIIRADGYIVTCHHVIYILNSLNVVYREKKYRARWCGGLSNPEVDIAILKIDIDNAKPVQIAFPKNQVISAMVYGFPHTKTQFFSKGFDVYGTLSQSPPINTRATYNKYPEVAFFNSWNKKPREDSTFLAYRFDDKVDLGISGGLVLDRESCCAIGVIQSTCPKQKESYIISWKNIVDTLKQLGIDPGARDAFSVVSLRTQQSSIPQLLQTNNIPNQDYRELLDRNDYIEAIMEALNDSKGRRIISIDGLGGVGKTSLAREVAQRCLSAGFERVVWQTASIRDSSERMTFETVLDGIARQLDEPNLLKLKGEEKQIKILELLNSKRVLVVLDNMETAKEPQAEIAYKLRSVLGSSKAILTSRHRFKNLEHDIYHFPIKGISKEASLLLIRDTAIEKNMPTVLSVSASELEPIVEVTGNTATGYLPMALKFMVGQLEKYEPEEMLEYLKGVRLIEENGEISGDNNEFRLFWKNIFLTSLRLLSPLDKRFMGGMTLFEPNIGTSREEIVKYSIGISEQELAQARDNTWRVSFLEIGSQGLRKRFYLHRLTYTFFSAIIQMNK